MPVRPPAEEVLAAEHPGLAEGAIADRRPQLQGAICGVAVIPVESLATADIGLEIGRIIDGAPARQPIRMLITVAPVGERHVVVDADEAHLGRRPQRIEVEEHVARPVLRLMAGIFRPVGAIGDECAGQDRLHLARECPQHRDEGKLVGLAPQRGEARKLAADEEGVHTSRQRAELRIMQDHAAVAPFRGARVVHRHSGRREVLGQRAARKGGDLGSTRRRPVGGSRTARRHGASDAAAPRIGRLLGPAIRVGAGVARCDVHGHEGMEHHLQPARPQVTDGADHRGVRGCAAKGGPAIMQAHQMRRAAPDAAGLPWLGRGFLLRAVDAGLQLALAAAQVAAEPCHHQCCGADVPAGRRQLIHRHTEVAALGGGMGVLRQRDTLAARARDDRRVIAELGRSGDDAHRPHMRLDTLAAAEHLEGQLRQAVAEIGKRQLLEHHIGDAAIGRRVACTFDRADQAVGLLCLAAGMKPRRDAAEVEFLAVGPHTSDAVDLALAQRHGEIGIIAVGPHLAAGAAAAALAAAVGLLPLDQVGGPDHLARHPHPAPQAWNGRPLGGGHHAQVGKPGTRRRLAAAEQLLVDEAARHGAHGAPDHAAEGAANQRAEPGTCRLQNNRRHHETPGKRNTKARCLSHHGESATSVTAACSWACTMAAVDTAIPACFAGSCGRQRNSSTSPAR